MSFAKFYKKTSLESGSFTQNGNRNVSWSFTPDDSDDVDLSKSYLDLTCKITGSNGSQLTNETVQMNDLTTEVSYPSSAIVRNCRLVNSMGVLEEVRESNRLSTSLYHYENTTQMKAGRAESHTGEQVILNNGEAHLMVPIQDLRLGCAQPGVKLTKKHGECHLEVELEDSKKMFSILNLSSSVKWKISADIAAGSVVSKVITSTTFVNQEGLDTAIRTDSKWNLGGTVVTVDFCTIQAGNVAEINFKHPVFFATQVLSASAEATPIYTDVYSTLENIAAAGSPTTITINKTLAEAQAEIALNVPYAIYYYDATNNKAYGFIREITALADAAPNTTATLSSAITFTDAATNGSLVRVYDDCEWEVVKAEMVYCKTTAGDEGPQVIDTYKTESMNIQAVSEFRNQVLLPQNPVQVVLVQETSTKLCGDDNDCSKYRLTVDNNDKTNRDVDFSIGEAKSHEVLIHQTLKPKVLDQEDSWVIAEQLKQGDKMLDFTLKSETALTNAGRLHVFKKHEVSI